MSDSEEEDTDISESELESYAESCYDQLNVGGQMVKVSEDAYHCPYCCGKKKQTFTFNALLQHAAGVSQGSSKRRTKDRGNHLGLQKYMQKVMNGEESLSEIIVNNKDEVFVWPWVGVMANVGESRSKLRDELTKKGFNPVRVHPLWNSKGHSGYAVVEFRNEFLGLFDALRFEQAYEALHQGKRDYFGITEKGDKMYCWVARDDDFHSENKIGEYLQKNGNLKTIEQYHKQEKIKNSSLISNLKGSVDVQDMHIRKIETRYKETYISLCSLISEKDEMVRAFDKERQELQLEVQKNKLNQWEQQSNELKVQNENLRLRLEREQRENEELQRKIINLEKELEAKQALELDIQDLRGNLHVVKHMGDDGDEYMEDKLHTNQQELEEKKELEHHEELNHVLVVKECKRNDELQEPHKKFTKVLTATKRKYLDEGIEVKVGDWDSPRQNGKILKVEDGKCYKTIMDKEDAEVRKLRNELGEEASMNS